MCLHISSSVCESEFAYIYHRVCVRVSLPVYIYHSVCVRVSLPIYIKECVCECEFVCLFIYIA